VIVSVVVNDLRFEDRDKDRNLRLEDKNTYKDLWSYRMRTTGRRRGQGHSSRTTTPLIVQCVIKPNHDIVFAGRAIDRYLLLVNMHTLTWAIASSLLLATAFDLVFATAVSDRLMNRDHLVCGNRIYNTDDQICCDGILYNTDDYICCEDTPHRKHFSSYACCGSEAYETDFHMCCQGSVQWTPSLSDVWICCGNSSYNVEISMCCEDTVQWKPLPYYVCCGRHSYNPNVQTCCSDGTVQFKGDCQTTVKTRFTNVGAVFDTNLVALTSFLSLSAVYRL